MRRTRRACLTLAAAGLWLAGCSGPPEETAAVPGYGDATKSSAAVRAKRRAYDGAPPVMGHEDFDIACSECHDREGMEVPDVGFAPPSPHEQTRGLSAESRCQQCHVERRTETLFVANAFFGLPQNLRSGDRLFAGAPPRVPHRIFMRETCAACHSGPAAREPIRTSHPERTRCRQCHAAVLTSSTFEASAAPQAASGGRP